MIHKLKYACIRLIDWLIPKKKNSIFIEPHGNCMADKIDIINYSGSSCLTFLNYLLENKLYSDYKIKVLVYHPERIRAYRNYISKYENRFDSIELLVSSKCYQGKKRIIVKTRNTIKKFLCRFLFCDTLHAIRNYLTEKHEKICLGYFSSFKSNFNLSKKYNTYEYAFLPQQWKLICSTSKLDSTIKSAAFGIPFGNFQPLGLARNDYFWKEDKVDLVYDWIFEMTNRKFSKIVLYAPTFRDYENKDNVKKRNIWGYEEVSPIQQVLVKNNVVVIVKLHSWQNTKSIREFGENVLGFIPNFNFTVYDVMRAADILITDYSSIALDFMLLNKPLIFNHYDEEEYILTRGVAFEPFEDICAGEKVKTATELANAIDHALYGISDTQKYSDILNRMFKYHDGQTCERIYHYLNESSDS